MPDSWGECGEAAHHQLRQGVVRGKRGLGPLCAAQSRVPRRTRQTAPPHHRRDGVPQQPEPSRVQRPPGDGLLQRPAQNRQVLLGSAVLPAAGVLLGQQLVPVQQGGTARQPGRVRGEFEHPAAVPAGRLQPVREQLVPERLPYGECLALCLHGRVGAPPGQRRHGGGDATAVQRVAGVRRGPTRRRAGQESESTRERRQLRDQVQGGGRLPVPDQPRHGEQGALLGHGHLVPSAVQLPPQPGESGVGETVREQRPPVRGHTELLREPRLVRLERAARARGARGEAAVHHLGVTQAGNPATGVREPIVSRPPLIPARTARQRFTRPSARRRVSASWWVSAVVKALANWPWA